jgi:hypothetical protein
VKFTEWAIARVAENAPVEGAAAGRRIQELVDALRAARTGGGQIFGMGASSLEPEGRPRVEAAIVDQLICWKEHYVGTRDAAALLDFDRIGRALDLPELLMMGRPKLLCAPDGVLGSREGLDPAWRARLERVDEIVRGERTVDFRAVRVVGFEVVGDEPEEPPVVECGAREDDALFEMALRFESANAKAFPREVAAFVSTLNGLTIDDDPFLRPISQWSDNDDGLEIGCGGYVQGMLTIESSSDGDYVTASVVDRDDDGEVRAEYANLAAFIDALTGQASELS